MHFEALGSPVYARLAGRLALDPGPAQSFCDPPDVHDPLRPSEGAVEDAYELRVWPGPPRRPSQLDFRGNWLEWLLP